MEHDFQLRGAARAIYDACYPTEEWAPCGFEEAERFGTVHYWQAVGAAQEARLALTAKQERQLLLSVVLREMHRLRELARRSRVRLRMPSSPPSPAAFVISRVMRPGHEEAYDPWAACVIAAGQVDEHFVSAVRLDQAGALHHLVLQFADAAALKHWSEQEPYAGLASEADAFSVGLDQNDSGAIMCFDLPSEVAAKKWKTALVTWLGVVPTLLIVSSVIGWVLPNVPRVVQQVISSVLLTSALTWLILPRVRGWSRFWMMQNERGDLRKEPG